MRSLQVPALGQENREAGANPARLRRRNGRQRAHNATAAECCGKASAEDDPEAGRPACNAHQYACTALRQQRDERDAPALCPTVLLEFLSHNAFTNLPLVGASGLLNHLLEDLCTGSLVVFLE